MIEKPVGRFGLGPAAASLGKIHAGTSKKIRSQTLQAALEPFIGQQRPAKFLFQPVLRRRERLRCNYRPGLQAPLFRNLAEPRAEIARQSINKQELFREFLSMRAVLSASAGTDSDRFPVGRLIAGAPKAAQLNKAFHQHGPIAEVLLPILS